MIELTCVSLHVDILIIPRDPGLPVLSLTFPRVILVFSLLKIESRTSYPTDTRRENYFPMDEMYVYHTSNG